MSAQRIDLYRDDLRPLEPRNELPRNLALIGLALVAMLVWGGVVQWQASTSERRVAALSAEQESTQAAMATASAQLAARRPDAALTLALVEAQFAVDGRRWLVGELSRAGDEAVRFSGVLEGLGRRRPAPLWLTRIHIAESGAELGLGGRTLDAEAVPRYLEGLASEAGFSEREFTFFSIERPAEAGEPLAFDMATDYAASAMGCSADPAKKDAP
jgi:Tfp pilus assembly protein PilN